jgi:GT2 family glycosyltransferase
VSGEAIKASTTADALAVVVYHSGPERLRRCLESLAAQDHPRLRITLVDHSPEGVPDATKGLARVTRLRPPDNTGFGGGVAAALATDDAPLVLLLNPDAHA